MTKKALENRGTVITLTMFKVEFFKSFFPPSYRKEKGAKFANLQHGNMCIEDYLAKFSTLLRFAPDIADNEEAKADQFINGLNPDVFTLVNVGRPNNLVDALDKAKAEIFVALHSFPVKHLSSVFAISSPMGKYKTSASIVRGCELQFDGNAIELDFIVLGMSDFDCIIGIDALTKYRATVDYFHKLLQQGAEGFLVYALDVLKYVPELADIPVVCEFSDIFSDEIPGLPAMREIDFSIELVPGTLPISKAPYRMAPLELKELKERLEYLLNKGYIRPSVSPWGAPVLFVRNKDMHRLPPIESGDGISVDHSKLEAVINWPRPTFVPEIRSFMGLARYYRRFIAGFSSIAKPITQLTQKNAPYVCTDDCEASFIELKKRLTSAPVLSILSGTGKSNASADALSRKVCDLSLSTLRVSKLIEDFCVSGLDFVTDARPVRVSMDGVLFVNRHIVVPDIADLRHQIMNEAHCSKFSIHPGGRKMYNGLKQQFWWKKMKADVTNFVSKCLNFQQMANVYIKDVVRLHGVPKFIVSDRDPRFTSHFWNSIQEALGTRLHLSIAYHPQSDGQSEQIIQILEDMLRAVVLDFGASWQESLPLVEFSYNNSYRSSIGMDPFEALYGRKCRSPLFWDDLSEAPFTGPYMIRDMSDKVKLIQTRMRTAQDRQEKYANVRRRPLSFAQGDRVFLKISPFRGTVRFGNRGKLSPRFIVPYEILDKVGDLVYRLALPRALSGIHDVFHVSMLRKYEPVASHVLHPNESELDETLSYFELPIQILDHKEKQL
ncbi:uncharacterized protein [Henckelia pumila]|uniref:uncharacterized protein n=1 Tax=Henckelia pumila TaxID=405737 RepID=UPI003C6DC55B